MGYNGYEISIVFTDNTEIKELNNTYRGINKPTNVLSFPMLENINDDKGNEIVSPDIDLLGDVIISVETALKEADQAKITLEQRISQLFIHGILHLIGYDHENSEEEFQTMEEKSLELLDLIEDDKSLNGF